MVQHKSGVRADNHKRRRGKVVIVNDKMQQGFRYVLAEPSGRNFDIEFKPELTPKEMLALGVFGGKYMTDCRKEFPSNWFTRAKLSPFGRNDTLNYFGVNASQPLSVWRRNGWIHDDDPRGWFQWYCRYFMGRRMPEEDKRQIKRWKAFRRHIAQIKQNCEPGDPFAGRATGRPCCTGPMTAEISEGIVTLIVKSYPHVTFKRSCIAASANLAKIGGSEVKRLARAQQSEPRAS